MNYTKSRIGLFLGLPVFSFLLLVGTANSVHAQQAKVSSASEAAQAKKHTTAVEKPAAPGTYQFLAKDANSHEVFPYSILFDIEQRRHESKVVYMNAGTSTVVKILPYKEINSKKFVPLPETGIQQ